MATVNVTPIRQFVSGETVTPTKLNELSQPTVAVSAIQAADISDSQITTAKIADTNVTTAKLATVTQNALLPAGAVMPFARATKPSGWLEANGDTVPNGSGTVQGVTADFSALYAAVSTSFGTAGTLPDLRGIFVRGSGEQTISGSAFTATFSQKQSDMFRSHTHSFVEQGAIQNSVFNQRGGTGMDGAYDIARTTGASGETETRPANIALLYCIKY